MQTIQVSPEAKRTIELAAKLANTTTVVVVDNLLYQAMPQQPAETPESEPDIVYGDYKGHRTTGKLTRETGRVEITSGPLAGQTFGSPSGAARAIIALHSGNPKATRDGWNQFWRLTSNSQPIQTVRTQS